VALWYTRRLQLLSFHGKLNFVPQIRSFVHVFFYRHCLDSAASAALQRERSGSIHELFVLINASYLVGLIIGGGIDFGRL
jgi:hypothetical protein